MSFLSKGCVYGLRAAVFVVANQQPDRFVSIREISEQLGISFHFLTKILQQLTEAGIMVSYRGPNGGVAMAKDADKVSVKDVIESVQGPEIFKSCILGLEGCGEATPCPLHAKWAVERERISTLFADARLSDLARQARTGNLRLSDQHEPVRRKRKA